MQKHNEKNYLLTQQYQNSSNLRARINLHERFTTNRYDWFVWVFDHFNFPAQVKILEVGCGTGLLWKNNLARIQPGWQLTLTDMSGGMLEDARQNLDASVYNFEFEIMDAQHIPFPDSHFDAVIANHMLYHVPDRLKAIVEFHRVLKPEGILYCSTNGENHLLELDSLFNYLIPGGVESFIRTFSGSAFTLENGNSQLSPWFTVSKDLYPDALEVTDPDAIVAYIFSMLAGQETSISEKQINRFRNMINEHIQKNGSFHISKSTGLFIALNNSHF